MANPQSTEAILAKLAEVFSPSVKEVKETKDRILSINGTICSDVLTLDAAKKKARQLATTDAVIKVYKLEGTLSVDLNVALAAPEALAEEDGTSDEVVSA